MIEIGYNLVATLQPPKQVAHPSANRHCYNVTTYFQKLYTKTMQGAHRQSQVAMGQPFLSYYLAVWQKMLNFVAIKQTAV